MNQHNLDVLVATSPFNVAYFSGFAGRFTRLFRDYYVVPGSGETWLQHFALLDREGNSALVVPLAEATVLAETEIDVNHVVTYGGYAVARHGASRLRREERRLVDFLDHATSGPMRPEAAVEYAVRALGRMGGRVGFDRGNMSGEVRQVLNRLSRNGQALDATEMIRLVRMVKSSEETDRLRKVATINEMAGHRLREAIQEGVSERQLVARYHLTIVQAGAIPEFVHCPSGTRSGGFLAASNYRLHQGDVSLIDHGCVFQEYHADTGYTTVLGEPSREQRRLYEASLTVLEHVQDHLVPGMRCSDLIREEAAALRRAGLDLEGVAAYPHGIGIELRDYPIIAPWAMTARVHDDVVDVSADFELEPGMVLNIEVPYCILGFGGFHNEVTVEVGVRRAQPLIRQRRRLFKL